MSLTIEKITENHSSFLRDESRKTGRAETISFPADTGEAARIVAEMYKNKTSINIQGARTGISGGAVPNGGHIISLTRMNRVLGMRFDSCRECFILKVQPGLELGVLRNMIEKKEFDTKGWDKESLETLKLFSEKGKWFFPPDPTETSASIGGMAACNASGAQSFYYGPTRNYIEAVTVVLADGSTALIRRGCSKAEGNAFSIKAYGGGCLENTGGHEKIVTGTLPDYTMPKVKNASGYYSQPGMDLVDLFIGSEGTLGIITEIEIRLIPKPNYIWGITSFFINEHDAIKFVSEIRRVPEGSPVDNKPAAIEFFNSKALELLRKNKKENAAFRNLLDIPEDADTAIYIEYHGQSEEEMYAKAGAAALILDKCRGCSNQTWAAINDSQMEQLHFFRHAVPEAVNLEIDARRKETPGLTKLGTDMAVPDSALEEAMEMYNRDLAENGFDSVIFGHIGNNHVHVNILPRSMEEYARGKQIYHKWAQKVISLGGTISAEHGIGKLKTEFLRDMYGDEGIAEMKKVKKALDPDGILNAGNLF